MSVLSLLNPSGWGFSFSWGQGGTSQHVGKQETRPTSGDAPVKIVGEEAALQLSAVFSCTKILVELISTLPLNVFERLPDDGRKKAEDHSLQYIFTRKPNPRQTPIEFRQTQLLNLVLHGNSYARIERNSAGDVIALWPFSSEQVCVDVLPDGTTIYMRNVNGNVEVLSAENVFHIKLFGNGIVGLSPIGYARKTLGIAASADQYAGKFYQNAAKPGGILMVDKALKSGQREKIRENFKDLTEGSENAHQLFVLEADMKFEQATMNADDAQMLETRKFSVPDICRFFGVPSFLVNSTDGTTMWGTGVESIMMGFLTVNIRPYLVLIESAYSTWLIKEKDRRKYFVEHNFDALLRADSAGRAEFYSKMTGNGMMTRNEVRVKENLPKDPNGNELTAPLNLAPLKDLGKSEESAVKKIALIQEIFRGKENGNA